MSDGLKVPTTAADSEARLRKYLNVYDQDDSFDPKHLIHDGPHDNASFPKSDVRAVLNFLSLLEQEIDALHESYNREYVKDTEELWGRINKLSRPERVWIPANQADFASATRFGLFVLSCEIVVLAVFIWMVLSSSTLADR